MQEYITVLREARAEYTEKHSRFLAALTPCESEEQAAALLRDVRSRYWDAKHHCYAYSLADGTRRFSDDGEPHGTAGKPILEVLEGSGLTNVLLVVTRYFGGVLLGTGGLVRAYSKAAKDAVNAAERAKMTPCTVLRTRCPYADHDRLIKLIEAAGGVPENTEFADEVTLIYHLQSGAVPDFLDRLCEGFAAKITAEPVAETLCPVKIFD